MRLKIESVENGYIVTTEDGTRYVYTSEAELMKHELSYLFQQLAENNYQLTVTIKTDAEEY